LPVSHRICPHEEDLGRRTRYTKTAYPDRISRHSRKSADVFGHQASRVPETYTALAEQTIGNAAELGNRLARSKHPLEWVEAHSEFMSKQLQAMATGAHRLGEALAQLD
jgi:hypothetical protein